MKQRNSSRAKPNWMRTARVFPAIAAISLMLGGCVADSPGQGSAGKPGSTTASSAARIVAQGQLLPAGGLIRIFATPGDVVEKVLVQPGESVTKGKELMELRSAKARLAQLHSLEVQRRETELQMQASRMKAEQELSAAKLQLLQAKEQLESIPRREKSLELAKQQVADAETALGRAENMAEDPLTKGMIGILEIDKLRSQLTAAKLQYSQLYETWLSAKEAAEFASKAVAEKVLVAERGLEIANQSDPALALDAQIAAAKAQLDSALITAPMDCTVVAVDARVGEAAGQFPLLQVADLSKMICRIEVYQTDAPRLAVGQTALIRNTALTKALRGKVARIDRLIGNPQLRSSDPLAKIDYRTIAAIVEIDSEDGKLAAEWLQLQVEVEVETGSGSSVTSK